MWEISRFTGRNSPVSEKLWLKESNMGYVSKKIRAFSYYADITSPTFGNALGSLTRAGYSYNYAKSYGRQVFLMDRFIDALFGLRRK